MRGRGRGARGRGRGVCGKGSGRSTISTTPSFLQHIPDEAVSIETMDVGFMERDNFQPSRDTGLHLPEGGNLTELDIFNLFFTDEMVDNLVCGTNDYAQRNKGKKKFLYRVFMLSPLTCDEMRRFCV